MSGSDLGRVKTPFVGKSVRSQTGPASGRDRGDQRHYPNNIYYSGQIIGQNREGHLGGYLWEGLGQEVRRTVLSENFIRRGFALPGRIVAS